MKGFVGLVAKERIVLHVPSQDSAMDQIGMKDQRQPFGLVRLARVVHTHHLARPNEYQRSFLVVVGMPAVPQLSLIHI